MKQDLIKRLVVNNLVLIEQGEIEPGPHFNAITGETGSGKTALIEALHLCLGERAETDVIRKGSDRAFTELTFFLSPSARVRKTLEEAGLDAEDELVIRRELSKEGRSRAFINCKAVPLPLLQEIGRALIDLIGQHSHLTLRSSEAQREALDLFGSMEKTLVAFQESYREEKEKTVRLEELEALGATKERDEEVWRFQLEELKSAHLKEDEEDQLFSTYEKLSHSQEIAEKVCKQIEILSALIPQLNQLLRTNGTLSTYDPSFSSVGALIQEALIPLKEGLLTLERYSQQEWGDPKRLAYLEERLSLISKLKRKYGSTFKEIMAVQEQLEEKLLKLSTLAENFELAKAELGKTREKCALLAKELTEKRTSSASLLQNKLTELLQELNMGGARVEIKVLPQMRGPFGEDLVQFWLQANPGENPCLVKEHASGGEVSRLLFALKILLAEKNQTPALIFDEIDANVGGRTATLIGKKLKELGRHKQVLCITHFPQVATQAQTHFQVQKVEIEGRALTQITCLTQEERERELARMSGSSF